MLLELCHVKCWAVAGMSIEYVKCLDLIPLAVHEPGHVPCPRGHVQAPPLGVQGCRRLGDLGRATNGILHGCPLSVVLVNFRTNIWKSDVNSLQQQVCAPDGLLAPSLGY